MLPITGHQQTSLIDFPGKIATVFFFAGCDLRCPYCHNSSLFEVNKEAILSKEYVLSEIEKRSKFIDGVSFSGGEPTLYEEFLGFLKEIKEKFKLEIKIDSNGLRPEFIEKALPYLSHIAIDIKTTPDLYSKLGCMLTKDEVKQKLLKTKEILENSKGVKIEYRTTMYPPIVESYERVYKMFEFIPENAEYYLQRFISDNACSAEAKNTKSYTVEQLERMALEIRRNTRKEKVFVRTYA
ncbi:MAG TPA: anaerobic ribonucleoside-triphosphate reductase activating protein [bacterium]|jgi:pyruvate formate lyase activating enzyme|nr:anaerobic ribonucleoside-triphosphate reductase activating protein [bacterium]MDX9806447.1 anaerobic ribonucleoside-triphosphate reductase activating protein [bacterium]HNW15321.1 anaerobic ribonucleoside-triphosphate reductase activating protein [bacterium]HNZ53850.1 anaerobic ribonucleoside-triphosphate reductase activating protein [bacterium]HOG43828.1 anaerobic ribonucleoside-triphosphate reductase activating protein [bacterium]